MSSPIDIVLENEGWSFGRPPARTRLSHKLVARIIGAARRMEIEREEEVREWDVRYKELADLARAAEREKAQLQREVFELTNKLKNFELASRMASKQFSTEDQRFILDGPKQEQEQEQDHEAAA